MVLMWLCSYKDVEIIEAHAMVDHIHMLVKIPPKLSVSNFMGYLKGKSSLMIFERFASLNTNLEIKYFGQKDTLCRQWDLTQRKYKST